MFAVIGTATVDLFVSNLPAMPRSEGDEFTVDSLVFFDQPLRTSLGGNGANSACALARLGAPTALVARLGKDHLGDWMAAQLREAGVATDGVRQSRGWGTATTLILSDRRQNRMAFYHDGANRQVERNAVSQGLLQQSQMLLLTSYSILPGLRPDGAVDLLRSAQNAGAGAALDIGPAVGEPARLDELRPLLPHTDYFICNQHELQVCTGEGDLASGMAAVLHAGANCIVIKRGAAGAAVLQAADRGAPVEVPGFPVDVQTTVGAGDSFNAGFLLAVQEGAAPAAAARFGNAAAAIVISTADRPLASLSRGAVDRLVEPSAAG